MSNEVNQDFAFQEVKRQPEYSVEAFKRALVDNLYFLRGQASHSANDNDIYTALAYTVRDYLVVRVQKTVDEFVRKKPKFVYYLSAEYLPGRQITQNLLYTGTMEIARQALEEFGYNLDDLIALEPEPALGNGGLGRLAACYFDSLATLGVPSVSYGIHYEFGIFKQTFRDGWQVETPDEWLYYGNPWEFLQQNNRVEVCFGGHVEKSTHVGGKTRSRWIPREKVLGEPCHVFVPGYQTGTVNMLRLWRAKASQEFDYQLFDVGDYARAAEQKIYSENITKVLYPNDNTPQGRELRLKQEYFFVSCSLQDILRRFLAFNDGWDEFPDKVVIQLNDTHPVVVIPELMRLLMDVHGMSWERAWGLTSKVFAYTCHTLMPEALEKWPVSLFERLLPRHMEIIYQINHHFLDHVWAKFGSDPNKVTRMSIIEEGPERMVRMAYLASAACFSINGVAELHSKLLRENVLSDFYDLWPEKFNNKTNGVTPRRFMRLANPRLSDLIDEAVGEGWLNDMDNLRALEPFAEDREFRKRWREIKLANKTDLAAVIRTSIGVSVDPASMFDVMVKRLHEYKRQLLKVLHIITLYNRLKINPTSEVLPRTFIFGAKAAPGYHAAKLIIKLINSVGEVINNDPQAKGLLKVAFLPNFNVTLGERIYPAADLSEQISMAGKEASGTGNMKFALNGALTIGTLDGANIEIRERVGEENFFLFGNTAEQVASVKANGYTPRQYYESHPELKAAIDRIASGHFSHGDPGLFRPLVDSLLNVDEYLVLADYAAYLESQDAVARAYRDPDTWARKSILNVARCGYFSSDRSIREYCEDIWKVEPVPIEP